MEQRIVIKGESYLLHELLLVVCRRLDRLEHVFESLDGLVDRQGMFLERILEKLALDSPRSSELSDSEGESLTGNCDPAVPTAQ